MSTIEKIVQVENEAEAYLVAAQKESEEIKKNGKAQAERIVAAARAKRIDDEKTYFENIEKKINEISDINKKELEAKLKSREKRFNEKANQTAKFLVNQIIIIPNH